MGHVDALSRREISAIINTDDIEFLVQVAQERDKGIEVIRNRLEKEDVKDYELVDGLVYKKIRRVKVFSTYLTKWKRILYV